MQLQTVPICQPSSLHPVDRFAARVVYQWGETATLPGDTELIGTVCVDDVVVEAHVDGQDLVIKSAPLDPRLGREPEEVERLTSNQLDPSYAIAQVHNATSRCAASAEYGAAIYDPSLKL